MEIQLNELIAQIKKDGVTAAEAEAEAIIRRAHEKAEAIISDAKSEAQKIIKDAKIAGDHFVRAGDDTIRQAGRNMLISFRESVSRELEVLIGDSVKSAYSAEALSALIVKAIEAWAQTNNTDDLAVLLNPEDVSQLESSVRSALKEKLMTAPVLKTDDTLEGGFRISVNQGRAYYDYSPEAVTRMLSAYLNPRLTTLMKEAENL